MGSMLTGMDLRRGGEVLLLTKEPRRGFPTSR
jgi:hypothetical protein